MLLPLIRSIAVALVLLLSNGCGNSVKSTVPVSDPDSNPLTPRSRYSFNNKCFALKSTANNLYVTGSGAGAAATYTANAAAVAAAAPFYLKSSALGEYLLYNASGGLVTAAVAASNPGGATCTPGQTLCSQPLDSATDSSVFVIKSAGDATAYPPAPLFDMEPTAAQINAYRGFTDPNLTSTRFTLASQPDGRNLTTGSTGAVTLAAAVADSNTQQFSLEALTAGSCAAFPEAQNNAVGETFKGTTVDGRVIGMADTHVHVLSTTFLGGAKAGFPYHKFGVTHAVSDCAYAHGENGTKDAVGAAFLNDTNGHNTTGYPTFPEWPATRALTHESIYWKWLERAWLGGLRILVNDVVDNATLCELQRNASGTTSERCIEMETAREQIGSMYSMQDYIDAQYGGRGQGWWRVVLTPAEARTVVASGKLAVVIGMEITNLFNCQITYNPARQTEPFEEPGDSVSPTTENTYTCAMTETGAPNEIKTQMDLMHNLGMRQLISIHEFDTAFGGNGIFDGLILNLGNRENSGGNPTPGVPPDNPFDLATPKETPTGEFWTTYTCPTEVELAAAMPGDGYLWENAGGAVLTNLGPPPPLCQFAGQGGRPGGSLACYPAQRQCNARWMTPIGLYMYKMMMEKGLIFDFDHMTIDMKTQALELAEAQNPPYPFVSTHGTFGGTTLEQTRRVLKNGGHLYPSLGNGPSLLSDMKEVRDVWQAANVPFLFGFGFGTDTNGLSGQAGARTSDQIARAGGITYPYQLFNSGWLSDLVPGLDNDNDPATPYAGVIFNQPQEFDPAGAVAQEWHIDEDGSAHYGMLSEMVEEVRREIVADAGANPLTVANTQQMRDLFNSAEVYIQTWERTLAAQQGILNNNNGGKTKEPQDLIPPRPPILRAAPGP